MVVCWRDGREAAVWWLQVVQRTVACACGTWTREPVDTSSLVTRRPSPASLSLPPTSPASPWTTGSVSGRLAPDASSTASSWWDWLSSGFTSRPSQNRSFRRRYFQPVSWLSTEKLNQTQRKQTYICNKIYYNTRWTQVWSPFVTSSLARNGPVLVVER